MNIATIISDANIVNIDPPIPNIARTAAINNTVIIINNINIIIIYLSFHNTPCIFCVKTKRKDAIKPLIFYNKFSRIYPVLPNKSHNF